MILKEVIGTRILSANPSPCHAKMLPMKDLSLKSWCVFSLQLWLLPLAHIMGIMCTSACYELPEQSWSVLVSREEQEVCVSWQEQQWQNHLVFISRVMKYADIIVLPNHRRVREDKVYHAMLCFVHQSLFLGCINCYLKTQSWIACPYFIAAVICSSVSNSKIKKGEKNNFF